MIQSPLYFALISCHVFRKYYRGWWMLRNDVGLDLSSLIMTFSFSLFAHIVLCNIQKTFHKVLVASIMSRCLSNRVDTDPGSDGHKNAVVLERGYGDLQWVFSSLYIFSCESFILGFRFPVLSI